MVCSRRKHLLPTWRNALSYPMNRCLDLYLRGVWESRQKLTNRFTIYFYTPRAKSLFCFLRYLAVPSVPTLFNSFQSQQWSAYRTIWLSLVTQHDLLTHTSSLREDWRVRSNEHICISIQASEDTHIFSGIGAATKFLFRHILGLRLRTLVIIHVGFDILTPSIPPSFTCDCDL